MSTIVEIPLNCVIKYMKKEGFFMEDETKKCKYCQTDIPKKAKICPNCKKKQSGVGKWVAIVAVVLILFVAMGNTSSKNSTNAEASSQETKTVNNKKTESKTDKKELTDADFSVKEYLYENTIGSTLYFVVVTNNSDTNVSISANATAKDSNGNSIGADDMSIDILGAGETSIGYFHFDNVTGIDKVEYKLNYDDEPYYSPVINNLSVEQTLNDKNVILAVTNNGDKAAEFVKAYVLFLDSDNNIIKYDANYITDDDCEIKIGDTLSKQFDSYKEYDHVEVYFVGKADKY